LALEGSPLKLLFLSPSSLVPRLVALQKVPKKNKLSVIFDNNIYYYYYLLFCIILNNEATVRESFIHIFGMADTYFSELLAIPKSN
jgi:hypothetical protein